MIVDILHDEIDRDEQSRERGLGWRKIGRIAGIATSKCLAELYTTNQDRWLRYAMTESLSRLFFFLRKSKEFGCIARLILYTNDISFVYSVKH